MKEFTLQQSVDIVASHSGNKESAAREMCIPTSTLKGRLRQADKKGIVPSKAVVAKTLEQVKHKLRLAENELSKANDRLLTEDVIRSEILKLSASVTTTAAPKWTLAEKKAGSPGVPSLFISDLHWGESVRASQINGVNVYNITTAQERLKTLASTSIHLLNIISPKMDYPGIVLILGGDMISGNIHDELAATNELNTMPAILDLYGNLVSFIQTMVGQFGKVFVPCVTGNHGRDTNKIWNKDRHATSFDWLLYNFLAKHFEHDKRVTFLIPDGPDAYYKIYEHRYLLSHGDQFRGGDGVIGALGPIIRGDHRKRSRNGQIDMEYDTLLIGHWHQYIQLNRLIVNGSLKGYDEYAYSNNFPFEVPQQALWITHPQHGITYRMPVKLESHKAKKSSNWISIK